MGQFKYITNRLLPNKAGKEGAGKIRAFVKSGSDIIEIDYSCPECNDQRHVKQIFKRPINVKCQKCGFIMKLPKLRARKKF